MADAFEQAWKLLKSSYQSQLIFDKEGNYIPNNPFDIPKSITPLEERVSNTPIVSHIEWDPNTREYTLMGTNNERLSNIETDYFKPSTAFPKDPLSGFSSSTPRQFRRKKYYNKLLRGLLNAGINIYSDERNNESNPFHENFMSKLSPNIKFTKPETNELHWFQPLLYERDENFPTFGDSDLAQRDYGALPIQILPKDAVRNFNSTKQNKLPLSFERNLSEPNKNEIEMNRINNLLENSLSEFQLNKINELLQNSFGTQLSEL